MKRSDLSGTALEPDEPVSLTCLFDDGGRRRLTITAAEGAELAGKGTDLTRRRDRARHWFSTHLGKLAWSAVGLVIASLAIPALTKQWSDRQQELQLKDSIITEVSRASATAFAGAKHLRESGAEEARLARRKLSDGWEKSEGEVDARYNVYFRGSTAWREWRGYRQAIFVYIALGCCDEYRSEDLAEVRGYLEHHPRWQERPAFRGDPWSALACGSYEGCGKVASDYDRAYIWLGKELLDRRENVLRSLRDAKASGYSRGVQDFIGDVFSPLGA